MLGPGETMPFVFSASGLRDHPVIHDSQHRFRLADFYEIRRVSRG